MTQADAPLLGRIEASEALTRLEKAAETHDWAELKPEEAQEAATLLRDAHAEITRLSARLSAAEAELEAAQTCALKHNGCAAQDWFVLQARAEAAEARVAALEADGRRSILLWRGMGHPLLLAAAKELEEALSPSP